MDSYRAQVSCTNCAKDMGVLAIVKGKPIANLKCPECGCMTLKQGKLAGS